MSDAIEVKEDFERLHNVVREGLRTFVEVGDALAAIRDRKLFTAGGYKNFDEYCKNEFDFGGNYGRKLIRSAVIAKEFDVPNESVARAVASVPKEDREEVVTMARSRQPDLTASIIEDMHEELREARRPATAEPPSTIKFDEARQMITTAVRLLEALAQTKAGHYLSMSHIKADLRNAYVAIGMAVPTHECYSCSGEGCELCKGLGWIPSDMWDRRPKEFN
jgi:hypothetical protein